MCPIRPPGGVADCYTADGVCARNNTCAQLMMPVIECVSDVGYKNSTECGQARMRLHRYLQRVHRGIPLNCTCVTSPKQCKKFKAAIGLPEDPVSADNVIIITL